MSTAPVTFYKPTPEDYELAKIYPDTDGQPIAEGTLQYQWIARLIGNIRRDMDRQHISRGREVFVAGDLLWYPEEGNPRLCTAPDTMVAFGRPPGDRLSYLQWREGDHPADVTFEVWSPSNTRREMDAKRDWYETRGVREHYEIHPERMAMRGWVRDRTGRFVQIGDMDGWVSPLLNIQFTGGEGDPIVIYQSTGQLFEDFEDVLKIREELQERADAETERADEQYERAERQMRRAEAEYRRAEKAQQLAENEAQRAQAEAQRAETEARRAETEAERAEKLAAKLRELGVDPDAV